MNLLLSIFGGLLLTVLVFAGARAARLSSFWAAVLASGLPSLAYLGYASVVWPGLDVVTLHVVAYPTAAVLLYQLYGDKAVHAGPMHWAPKLLVGFFIITTLLFAGFVYVAGHGLPPTLAQWLLPDTQGRPIHTGFAGVVAHGEDAAKSIAHYRRMDATLARLGWQLEVRGMDGLRAGQPQRVEVAVRKGGGALVPGIQAVLSFARPGQAVEVRHTLVYDAGHGYVAEVALPGTGVWMSVLSLSAGGESVTLERLVGGD